MPGNYLRPYVCLRTGPWGRLKGTSAEQVQEICRRKEPAARARADSSMELTTRPRIYLPIRRHRGNLALFSTAAAGRERREPGRSSRARSPRLNSSYSSGPQPRRAEIRATASVGKCCVALSAGDLNARLRDRPCCGLVARRAGSVVLSFPRGKVATRRSASRGKKEARQE